ncbi:hypothetical protein B0H17DRAFT_1181709 [Mycena rosella]|uniref:Uncharacterized protein n=1 Tax=Mycena rosella TaxID=1033263 RepID=A0AAD7D783_MYCRO|nr:hypothetical protein B0H17DRAFT_1181709 [Mycena rosella]
MTTRASSPPTSARRRLCFLLCFCFCLPRLAYRALRLASDSAQLLCSRSRSSGCAPADAEVEAAIARLRPDMQVNPPPIHPPAVPRPGSARRDWKNATIFLRERRLPHRAPPYPARAGPAPLRTPRGRRRWLVRAAIRRPHPACAVLSSRSVPPIATTAHGSCVHPARPALPIPLCLLLRLPPRVKHGLGILATPSASRPAPRAGSSAPDISRLLSCVQGDSLKTRRRRTTSSSRAINAPRGRAHDSASAHSYGPEEGHIAGSDCVPARMILGCIDYVVHSAARLMHTNYPMLSSVPRRRTLNAPRSPSERPTGIILNRTIRGIPIQLASAKNTGYEPNEPNALKDT